MGLWDDLRKNAFGVVQGAVKGASSYLEELEKQAQEREKEKQKEAEKENEALQELEKQKQRIIDEIEAERQKLEDERAKLAQQRADPSYIPTSKAESKKDQEDEDQEEVFEEESSWDDDSESFSDDDIFGPEDPSEEDKGDLYPGTAEDKTTLLEQLADMTAQQNELARRLKEAGLEKEVEDIVGKSSDGSLYAVDTDDLGALSFSAKSVTRQFRTALDLMLKAMAASGEAREQLMEDAKSAIMGAEQAANDVEQLAAEMEKKAEEMQGRAAQPISIEESIKYDWKRKPIFISFGEPGDVFQRLEKIWTDISFGSKRDKDGRPTGFSRYSPYATARGDEVSRGYRVPEYAYKTETAFVNWCESVGLGDGVSLEVTSLMTKPGQSSMH